jgi:4-amino-4-deoxy-L-arabinose transferase-like glycosyltransferase
MSVSSRNFISKFLADHVPKGIDVAAILVTQFVFWIGIIRHIDLPGLYHDAINPDYIAAHTLNDQWTNPGGPLPTIWFPLLGNLYHGVQNYYVGLPFYWFFGMNIVSARLSQALFGAVIAFLLYIVSLRLTENRLIAFIATLGLASDIAFLASFRSQFYIILGGEAWLFAALSFLPLSSVSAKKFKLSCLLAGICCGLAVYGYFVFLFFLPGFLWLILCHRDINSWLAVKYWIIGVIIGLLPYVLGYVSLFIKFGRIKIAFAWFKGAVFGLGILSAQQTLWEKFNYALSLIHLALSNNGNVAMIFSYYQSYEELVQNGFVVNAKLYLFYLVLTVGVVFAVRTYKSQAVGNNAIASQLVILPLSYFFFAMLLGSRLWAHHFSVFVPLFYLLGGIVMNEVYQSIKPRIAGVGIAQAEIPIALAIGLLLFTNFHQQQVFFEHLDKTGGTGKATSALTQLAEEALTMQGKEVYFFPEWGFFPSFNLLTGNRIPYENELDATTIQKFAQSHREIRLLFWKESDTEKYVSFLKHEGLIVPQAHLRTFFRRDGKPAFYMIRASYPNRQADEP